MRGPSNSPIATLTFHWASNYGAVLQAYALQRALLHMGRRTFVLNYVPLRVVVGEWIQRVRTGDWRGAVRAVRIRLFACTHLHLRPRLPRSAIRVISRESARCSAVITGSDQVWNEWFVTHGPRTARLSYFLDFVPVQVKRVAYAVSFGAPDFGTEAEELVRPHLQKFAVIGVRESTGQALLRRWGLESTLLADPTLLHGRDLYDKVAERPVVGFDRVMIYLLHAGQLDSQDAAHRFMSQHFPEARVVQASAPLGVGRWLANIRDARFVITNSFHVVVFCLIFHTPFAVLPVRGQLSGMNDRFVTLLDMCGLLDRIVGPQELDARGEFAQAKIDWPVVDRALEQLRSSSWQFLRNEVAGTN